MLFFIIEKSKRLKFKKLFQMPLHHNTRQLDEIQYFVENHCQFGHDASYYIHDKIIKCTDLSQLPTRM